MPGPVARLRFRLEHRWSSHRMSEYLDGEMAPADEHRLKEHVERCPRCHELLRGLRATVAGLARIGRDDASNSPPSVAASIAAHVRSEASEREDDDDSNL